MKETATPISNLVEVLNTMVTHYHVSAETAGTDFGGEYEYEMFMELKEKAVKLRSQFEQMDGILDQLAVHVQICKMNHIPIDIDFDSLEMILSDYYDIQSNYYKQAKSKMDEVRVMLQHVQNAEKYGSEDDE